MAERLLLLASFLAEVSIPLPKLTPDLKHLKVVHSLLPFLLFSIQSPRESRNLRTLMKLLCGWRKALGLRELGSLGETAGGGVIKGLWG